MNHLARLLLLLALPALALAGCQNSAFKGTALEDSAIDQAPTSSIEEITQRYEQGDHQGAYDLARPVAWDRYRKDRYEAAYIAGLSAQALGNLAEAEKMLKKAVDAPDETLVVDASDALGMVHSQQGRYDQAKRRLFYAAERLNGEREARAYFYAGIAQQKLGEWSQARTTLVLARSKTGDRTLREQINDQVQVTGWTLQLGAFTERERARSQAQTVAAQARELRLGLPRLVSGTSSRGDSVTFVHVGQFTSYQSAMRYRDQLGVPGVIIRAMRP